MQEILMPSAIVHENDAGFKARVARNKARPGSYGDTAIFKNLDTGRNVVLGKESLQSGQPVRVTGPDKYTEGVLDNMVLGTLLKVLPDGYPNIIVSCAHTTNAIPYVEKMDALLNKKHTIMRYDGETVKYNIRGFIGWDEPAGGLIRHFHRNYVEDGLTPGKQVIVVDIGGRVSSMYPAEILDDGIEIYWSAGKPFPVGIQNVMELLEQEFRSLHPDRFHSKTVSERIRERALWDVRPDHTGTPHYFTEVQGVELEVTQAVLNATAPILSQIENVYVNDLESGQDASCVVVTGGGGGRLFDMICRDAVHHPYIYMAEEPQFMPFANLRGGVYATKVKVANQIDKLTRVIRDTAYPPIILGVDPGNTNIKAQIITAKDLLAL